ncbi:MAG: hypothetical protein ACD_76C00158G0001 [uncultured bacterium]|nr:MAG: hypothetical protein ACD_76C00158G0001 [uncultured bacterium]
MIVENSQVNPFTMRTLSPGKSNTKLADAIKQLSRLKYGRDKSIVDSEIMERAQLGERSASQPPEVGVPSL